MRVMIYGSDCLGHRALHLLTTYFRGSCSIAGFVDDARPAGTAVTSGYRVLGDLKTVSRFPATSPARVCLAAALEPADPAARGQKLHRARDLGYRIPVLVHPSAIVEPGSALGSGTIVAAGVTVGSATRVGDFCVLDQGVNIGDGVTVGENCHLAAGVTVTDGVTIGDSLVIPAGSVVEHDLAGDRHVLPFPAQDDGAGDAVIFDEVSHA